MALLWFLIAFFGMEAASWFIHKYLMHGFLWHIHRTHHQHNAGFFELNDLFSLFFGSVAVFLIFLGVKELDMRFWLGIGISAYGLVYFILHDVLIHRRLKWFNRSKNPYLKALQKAHAAHHKVASKDGSESFGLLVVAKKFFS